MTEAGWLLCEEPEKMLTHLRPRLGDRKLRLFCCACCRRVWGHVRDERLDTALDHLQRYAAGAASDRQRVAAGKRAGAVRLGLWDEPGREEEVCLGGELSSASAKTLRRSRAKLGDAAATAAATAFALMRCKTPVATTTTS